MGELNFLVQGSAPEPYEVTFFKVEDNLTALCTCPAGENGQYCKHRFAIMDGSTKGVVSDNTDQVKTVVSWLPGTDVEEAMNGVAILTAQAAEIKKRLSAAKRKLARAMRD